MAVVAKMRKNEGATQQAGLDGHQPVAANFIDISFFVSRGLPKSQREKEKASGKDTMRVIH